MARREGDGVDQLKAVVTRKVAEAEEGDEPLSPTARLFHQPNFNCYILAIMGCGKKIDVGVIKKGIEATLVRHPRFSSLEVFDGNSVGGKGRWVPTSVNLDDHITVPTIDSSAIPDPDQFVEDYISNLSTTSLDFSRPLWDLHVINLRTSEAESVAVLRCHHSLGDGISLISLLLACTRKSSDPTSLPTIPRLSGRKGKVEPGIRGYLRALAALLWVLWNTLLDMVMFTATMIGLKDTETPLKSKGGFKRRFVHRTVTLEDLKAVKRATDATINDVLLAMTSAGLTRYLSRRYASENKDGKGCLPDNIRLRSPLLVNVRKSPGIHALAEMMDGTKNLAQWGNCLGYVIVPLSIVHFDNPLEYVHSAKVIANRKKSSLESVLSFSCARLMLKIFGAQAASEITCKIMSNTTLSLSNVVGPVEEICFFGHPMVYLAPTVYGHPHALVIHFQSYMGKMKIVLAAEESTIPDPHQLCDDLIEALNLLKHASTGKEHH